MNELSTNPEIIKHYDLLKNSGILEHINKLNVEIYNLESLFSEAIEIFSKTSIDTIVEFVTSRLMSKFIPEHLVFVLQERTQVMKPEIRYFRHMQPEKAPLSIESLEPYKKFFQKYPNSISFSLFEYKLDKPEVSNELLPASPEILVPIIGYWGLYGLIVIGTKIIEKEYSPQEITYLNRLMEFASIGFQNNIHHKSSITDYKTGLYNHAFFTERLEEDLARVKRYKEEIAVLMLDIDHFKHFNDTHGHLVGDEVLIRIAELTKSQTRREDVCARFGGEEFVILMSQADKHCAWVGAERIRQQIENLKIENSGEPLKVTVSIGIRHVNYNTYAPAEDIIEDADKALYHSKSAGRNTSTLYNAGLLYRAMNLTVNTYTER